jgi:Fur family transcriptional regulator, peroxide stress response regulator
MNPADRLRDRMEAFQRICAARGLANTHQRQTIFRAIAGSTEHPSPERIYEKVKKRIPSVSLGTVYRNIRLFIDIGALRQVSPLEETLRLDPNLEDHHHLICRSCRSIVDVGNKEIAPIRFRRSLPKGFRVERCEVEVLGLCARCRSRKPKLKTKRRK